MSHFLESITMETPDGDFHIIIDNNAVARASGFGSLADLCMRLPLELSELPLQHRTAPHPYQEAVNAYYEGDTAALGTIPRVQSGTAFRERVWEAISSVPYGETISYKQLALHSGNPAAIRAAGTICGLNLLILLVPCHRILKSNGAIGSYLYGTAIKASLLQRERSKTAQ